MNSDNPQESNGRLIVLGPAAGEGASATWTDRAARSVWNAATAPWHPAILARLGRLPEFESTRNPSEAQAGDVVVMGDAESPPEGYRERAAASGASMVEVGDDRVAASRAILAAIDPSIVWEEAWTLDPLALDGFALGGARLILRDLTKAMGQGTGPDEESLAREVVQGARAWRAGDSTGATNRLRAAFEILTQARERFYPVDAYFIDLCLLDVGSPTGALEDALNARAPFTLLAQADAIEALSKTDPASLDRLRLAIGEGWADVAGGSSEEAENPLSPVESILRRFRKASEIYRRHLDDRAVETFASRRFGLFPLLPQIARRFGIRFGVPLAFDDGKFPIRSESKLLWESPDGSSLESLTRPPLPADRDAEAARLPGRIARSLKDDHVAVVVAVHWPGQVATWFQDFRRVQAYSPVFLRWSTLNDFFHLTDRPWETLRPELDDFSTPYLAQNAALGRTDPISRRAAHARLRAKLDAANALFALAIVLPGATITTDERRKIAGEILDLEERIEENRWESIESELDRLTRSLAEEATRRIVGEGESGRPGYLVLNPTGVARRVAVVLPGADDRLSPEGPLRAAQLTEEGTVGVVDLPAFGFAWVPRESSGDALAEAAAASSKLSASERVLRNESIEVEFDAATGGLRGVRASGESTSRLGQQIVALGLVGADGEPISSLMRGESFEIDYAGPALVQGRSRGTIVDPNGPRALARFEQVVRLWAGRSTLELDIALTDLDADWLDSLNAADPWSNALACRWAWPDPQSSLRRLSLLGADHTEADRPETPDAFDISTRKQRTALLFGGLAHHRRKGERMLDTLLVAGRESSRSFRLGAALDLEHPHLAATDFITPAWVVPTDAGPPRSGPLGWLFRLDHKGIAVTRVSPLDFEPAQPSRPDLEPAVEPADPVSTSGLCFHLIEAAGDAARARLRFFRDPIHARQSDFNGEPIMDLSLDGDAVLLDLTPRESARVEVKFE